MIVDASDALAQRGMVMSAGNLGKVKTASQMITLFYYFLIIYL